MFGMSMTEIVIILVIALLVLGPEELPKAAKSIGKVLRDVRRAGDDLRTTFEREVMYDDETLRRPVRAPEGAVASGSGLPSDESGKADGAENTDGSKPAGLGAAEAPDPVTEGDPEKVVAEAKPSPSETQ